MFNARLLTSCYTPEMKFAIAADSDRFHNESLKEGLRGHQHILLSDEDLSAQLSKLKSQGVERILVCGGDGSLNQIVHPLMKLPREQRLPLALVPMGTANDFATAIGLPTDIAEAVRIAATAAVFAIDVIRVNDHSFLNVASGGHVAKNTTGATKAMKGVFGRIAYYLTALSKATQVQTHQLRFRGSDWQIEEECVAFVAANSSLAGGGIHVAPYAKVDDGKIDLLIVPQQETLALIQIVAELLKDEPNLASIPVYYRQVSEFSLSSETPLQINLDGEPIKGHEFNFKAAPREIDFVMPQRP